MRALLNDPGMPGTCTGLGNRMNRHSDVPGSIRWASDIFEEPAPLPRTPARNSILLAVGLGVLVVIAILVQNTVRSAANRLSGLGRAEFETGLLRPVEQPTQPSLRRLRQPTLPVTDPPITNAEAASSLISDQDFVIGVEVDGQARAYALNMMGRPETELINDTLCGRPIAATFCGTCQSPLVFSREVGAQALTFFLSGELLNDNMVMEDVETGSKWAQLTGEAIAGPLQGQKLEQLATIWTDWRTWRQSQPATTVLKLPPVVENYRHHASYSQFSPEALLLLDPAMGPRSGKEGMVVAVRPDGGASARQRANGRPANSDLVRPNDQHSHRLRSANRRSGIDLSAKRRRRERRADPFHMGSVHGPVIEWPVEGPPPQADGWHDFASLGLAQFLSE